MVISNTKTPEITSPSLIEMAQSTQIAARELAVLSTQQKNQALGAIAHALEAHTKEILAANEADYQKAEEEGIPKALLARLKLGEKKLKTAITGVLSVVNLPDPTGITEIHRQLDEGLILKRITFPIGVLGVIFEARPEALIQIVSLAIKSGNGVILKGGKEATQSCNTLVEIIHQALAQTQVSTNAVQLLTTRSEIQELLKLDKYVNLIIPRGSNSFVQYIQANTNIAVLGHADGICHLYINKVADLEKAIKITIDAKTQYPAACNAIETLLVDEEIAPEILPKLAKALQEKEVELRGDSQTLKIIDIKPATSQDWATEYCDLILSIKIVPDLEAAISHINHYGSKHTDAIITEDPTAASLFLKLVDAASVYHNCSTRFADGFRYGFGAEVGISTQKMPPRGPVGLEGLVSYKYQLTGNGHVVATYTTENGKQLEHKDL